MRLDVITRNKICQFILKSMILLQFIRSPFPLVAQTFCIFYCVFVVAVADEAESMVPQQTKGSGNGRRGTPKRRTCSLRCCPPTGTLFRWIGPRPWASSPKRSTHRRCVARVVNEFGQDRHDAPLRNLLSPKGCVA